MIELIDHIPILDVTIVALLIVFIFIGWKSNAPRMLMVLGALYTGFLLAAVYYHLFAVALTTTFHLKVGFVADVISFLTLDVMATALMLALLIGLFSHIEIKGRAAVFGRVIGSMSGLLSGLAIAGILITLLHVPYETHKQALNAGSDVPVIKLFNEGYDRSALAPLFIKGAPWMLASVMPMLPPEAREREMLPIFEGITAQR